QARLWFGDTEIELDLRESTFQPARTIVHASLAALPIARIVDRNTDEPELLYTGVLQSLLASLSADGELLARFVYGPFGEILSSDGALAADHHRRFNGKELDDLTRLSYYGFRYYDRLT